MTPEQKTETLEEIAQRIASYCFARTDAEVARKRIVVKVALLELREEQERYAMLCNAKAVEYKKARDDAYKAAPTCDAVGENEIRQHVAETLATAIREGK